MKTNYKHILRRTKQMLIQPALVWSEALQEHASLRHLFLSYLLPIVICLSSIVCLLRLLQYNTLQALGLGIINLIAAICGVWLTYLIVREYLCRKLNYSDNHALNLSLYSFVIYIIFHSIADALGTAFIGEFFTLLSFIFLRTLYTGVVQLPELQTNHKTNILIIASLSIVFIPIIITQMLMILFGISAINI